MDATGDIPSVEALLSHQRWVGRLARSLVADEALADDLVQDVWLAALEHPMRHGLAPRSWLAKVLANLRRARHRSEAARAGREKRVGEERSASPADAPLEIVGRAETQHRLVADVLALAEPYRSTLLLRYFDDLSAEEIGRRQGLPSSTVRNRVKRGLELLRVRLQSRFGDEPGGWVHALTLIVPAQQSALTASATGGTAIQGWLAMGQGVNLAAATVAAVAVGAWIWYGMDAPDRGNAEPDRELVSTQGEALAGPDRREHAQLEAGSAEAEETARRFAPGGLAPALSGSVVSLDGGTPLADVRIGVVPRRGRGTEDAAAVLSGADGRFSMAFPGEDSDVLFERSGFLTKRVSPEEFLAEPQAELHVVMAPLGVLTVQVIDHADQPVPEAMVWAHSNQQFDGARPGSWIDDVRRDGKTDGAGRCALELPCGTSLSIMVMGGSNEFARIDPAERRAAMTLVRPTPGVVMGRIVQSDLAPATSVEVLLQSFSEAGLFRHAWTDRDGRYRFEEIVPGPIQVHVPGEGSPPLENSLEPGANLDLGTLTLAELALFSGRVQSRFDLGGGTIAVELLRDGRPLTETQWLNPMDPAFEARISPGPLVVRVSQHEADFIMDNVRNVYRAESRFEFGELLREECTAPAQNMVFLLDSALGALECKLDDEGVAKDSVTLQLRPLGAIDPTSFIHGNALKPIAPGTFRSPGFATGRYSVGVSAPGGTVWFSEVLIPPNGIADLGTLAWARGAIAGTVADGSGAKVPRAVVNLRDVGPSHERKDGATDEHGRYRFDGLQPGLYEIESSHHELGKSPPILVELTGGERTEDLVLGAWAILEAVLLRDGEPEPGLEIGLGAPFQGGMALKRLEKSDAQGLVRYDGLTPGRYSLFVRPQGEVPVLLKPGETKRVTWELERETQEVTLLDAGAPLANLFFCQLVVIDPASEVFGRVHYASVGAGEGRVVLPAIAERCALLLGRPDFEMDERWVQLVDGRQGRFPDVVDMSRGLLEVDVAPDVEAPRLHLIGFDGVRLADAGELPTALQRSYSPKERWVFRGIPEGALLSLEGRGRDGERVQRELDWNGSSPQLTSWP